MNFRKPNSFRNQNSTPLLTSAELEDSKKDLWTRRTWWYLAILSLISVLCYWFWFFNWGTITSGDWGYLGLSASRELWSLPSMIDRFGKVSLTIQNVPIFAVWGGLSYFFSFEIVSRLVYLFPSVLLPLYGSFVLTRYCTKSDLAAFVGATVFNSSIYFLMIRQGHLLLVCAYGMTPWIVYYFMRMMKEKKLKLAIILSFLAFLCGSFEFRGLYVTIWLVFLYYLYYNLVEDRNLRTFWRTSWLSAVTFGLFLIYNLYWLVPFSQLEVLSQNSLFDRPIITSEFFDLVRSFAMFIIWWSGSTPSPTWIVPLNFFVAPIAAIVGFYLNRRNKKVVFFAIVSILGIFLSKQAGDPFPDFYEWLYKNFVGFAAFREASKFYMIISLGYSILIGFLVAWLLKNWNKTFWQKIGRISVILLLITSFLWHNRPMISQEYGALTVPKTIPAEYTKFNNFIAEQSDKFSILGVPFLGNWFTGSSNHQAIDLVQAVQTDWAKVMDLPLRSIENPITTREITVNLFNKTFFEQFSKGLGIKYFIVPKEDKSQNPSYFESLGGRDFYVESVRKIPFIREIALSSPDFLVFENTSYKPQKGFLKNIFEVQTADNLSQKAKFVKENLDQDFNFYLNDDPKRNTEQKLKNKETTKITNLFENLKPDEVTESGILQNLSKDPKFDYQLFYNQNRKEIISSFKNGSLQIIAQNSNNLAINGAKMIVENNPKILWETKLNPKETYYLTFQGTEILLQEGVSSLGFMDKSESIGIYQKSQTNIVPNGSFEDGLWDKNYNCTSQNAENKSEKILAEADIKSDENRKNFLELKSQNQNSCNQTSFEIEPNQFYFFEFEVASSGKSANFLMGSNDPTAQVVQSTFPIIKENIWQKYQQIFRTESKTTRTNILLTNKSGDVETVNSYDNFELFKLSFVNSFVLNLPNELIDFVQVPLNLEENNKITYDFQNPKYGQNWIQSGDFENGLWTNTESKCGKDPEKSKMEKVIERDSQVVKLTTSRQDACTRTTIPVKSNSKVLFSFDYKSNTPYLSAYMAFNGSDKIIRQPNTFIKNTDWNTYANIFKTPGDTSLAELIIYTQGDPRSDKEKVNFYDNFKMVTIPDFDNQFFLLEIPKDQFQIPENPEINKISFTKTNFKFTNLKNDFFLSARESFSPNWKLTANPVSSSFLDNFSPFTKQNIIETENIRTNLNQNSWLVDLKYLCQEKRICQENSDGTYNLELNVEFWPQRFLNLGLLISVFTFAVALLTLIWLNLGEKRQNSQRNYRF